MESERHYFIVGLFVFLALAAAGFYAVWSLGQKGKDELRTYAIYFDQAINGVNNGSVIRLKGIPVGTVTSINFDPRNMNRIRVLATVDRKAPVDSTTRATVQLQGVTGLAVIALNNMPDIPKYEMEKDADGHPIIPSEPSQLQQVFDEMPAMIKDLRELARRGQNLLSDENVASLNDSLQAFTATLKSADKAVQGIGALSQRGQDFFSEDNNAQLREMLTEGKLTMREVRYLAKSLREDPSQVIYRSNYGGYNPDADAKPDEADNAK